MISTSRKTVTIIAGVPIDDKIFDEELVDYTLIDREDQVDDLITWISEIGYFNKDRAHDKVLMKEDLKYLMSIEDELVFSSITTNEFISQSDNSEKFKKICKDILLKSGLTEGAAEDALSGECL